MRQITALEFKTEIERNPAWATTLVKPVEVIGYCDMRNSKITHLSPLLHFRRESEGDPANFSLCPDLKMAEGTFAGFAYFNESGIEKIGELTILRPDESGNAATFWACPHLKVAEGTYPGHVFFNNSGIQKIGKLIITGCNNHGIKATFSGCDIHLPAEFLGPEYHIDEPVRKKNLQRIAASKAQRTAPDIEI